MKKYLLMFITVILISPILGSCQPRYSFNTREGKKKIKYYNSIQYRGYPTANKNKN